MKYTQYLLKTSKEKPADEDARNAELLIRGGFIHKTMAGVYSFLPLGLRVLRKIENIVRDEMDKAGSRELLMSALASKENWETTGRWNAMSVLFKMQLGDNREVALSPTHEELVTPIVKQFCTSPKDFPKCVYQIQTKFRNEARAKSGLLRGREFLMKDAYSFHLNQEDFEKYYSVMTDAYHRIFKRLGIGDITKIVAASGGDFSKFSHEFQTLSPIGEDEIYIDKKTGEAFNKEIVSPADRESGKYQVEKAIEVGNIFPLSTKFSKPFKFNIQTEEGGETTVIMGCYGIGISRLMGALAEIFADDKGLRWPKNVTPFSIYLAPIGKDPAVYEKADELYGALQMAGIEVLYDDRQDRKTGPGQKFADHELLGLPARIVLSEKTMAEDVVEFVDRKDGQMQKVKLSEIVKFVQEFLK